MNSSASSTGSRTRFLITGAKGFIGAWTVKNLVERGDRPYILDLDPESHRLKALLSPDQMQCFTFIRGDVTRFEDVERAVVENGVTHIIHLRRVAGPGLRRRIRASARR